MPQSLEFQTVPAIASLQIFTHIVTLLNRSTGDEKLLKVETDSPTFAVVMREIAHQRAVNGWFGYEIHEILDLNDPF